MASMHPPENGPDQQETLLEFPCAFPVKAMGRDDGGFEALVTKLILKHAEMSAVVPVTIKYALGRSGMSVLCAASERKSHSDSSPTDVGTATRKCRA